MNVPGNVRVRAVSTASVAETRESEILSLVDSLRRTDKTSCAAVVRSFEQSTVLEELRHVLQDNGDLHSSKSAFRRVGGYNVLLDLVESLVSVCLDGDSADTSKVFLQLLYQLVGILAASLDGHAGNQRYFRTKINGSGWESLRLSLSKGFQALLRRGPVNQHVEQFFGLLFAAAISDETAGNLYSLAGKSVHDQQDKVASSTDEAAVQTVQQSLRKSIGDSAQLSSPEFLVLLVHVWASADGAGDSVLRHAIPLSLRLLLATSSHNLVSAQTSGLSAAILPLLFDPKRPESEKILYRDTVLLLYHEGVSDLEEAAKLFVQARSNNGAACFLLRAIGLSQSTASIRFDLSLYSYSSIELASLGRPFPPIDSPGYTLSLWARFDDFDPRSHTTLFGAFDQSQTCFVLVYLERDTRQMILQTAIQGARPSVRFKSIAFETGKWYHIAIVHRRQRTTSSPRALLYVDGEFMEQQKVNYPAIAPTDRTQRYGKVQAFFGTPQDLSPGTTGSPCRSKWSLASASLFADALSDDLMTVFYHLGPRYHGNFQDCLGSFQTYKASAALNMRNELLHAGKEDSSDLILAIRQKASNLIREDGILINISPSTVLDSDDRNNIDETKLVRCLSKRAAKNLVTYTRTGANAIAINGAIPAINDALTQARGVAMLMGSPVVDVPQPFDNTVWQLAGCAPLGLSLVCQAGTTEALVVAVDILLATVESSWRNSEVMERDRGYEILAMLLREKMSATPSTMELPTPNILLPTPSLDKAEMSLRLLKSILRFIGLDENSPEQSVINNPMAYKALLIDTSIWRCGPLPVQELYFKQFVVFASTSLHSRFNLRRLSRMRVLRRLLEALKSEAVSKTVMAFYTDTFRLLLPTSMSAELLRSLALFITFAVNKRNITLPTRKGTKREPRPRYASNASSANHPDDPNPSLSHFEIGVEVLRLYSDFLCQSHDTGMIKRFAKTVTNKWLLYLLSETSPEVAVLSMRILSRLLVAHGEAYVRKFKDKTGGFTIMGHRLKHWWHIPALWPCCFAILFGVDIAKLDLDRTFNLFGFLELFNSEKDLAVVYPDMMEVIAGMLQSGLRTIVLSKQHEKASTLAPPQDAHSGSSSPQRLSMSTMAPPNPLLAIATTQNVETFNTVIRFIADLHEKSPKFQDYAASSSYVQHLLYVLFPVVVGSDMVDAITELEARDSKLTFDGDDVVVQPLSAGGAPPVVRSARNDSSRPSLRVNPLRRASSFVLLTQSPDHQMSVQSQIRYSISSISPISPATALPDLNVGHSIVQSLLEIVITVFIDQIVARKDFPGLGLFLRTPPGFVEHQSYFESWILRNTVSQLSNHLALNQRLLTEPKVITNVARFISHLGEALFEGWFIGGAESVLDLAGSVLEYLQRPDIATIKSVRLCSQAISVIRGVVFRTVLLGLSQIDEAASLAFLEKLAYWQTIILAVPETQSSYLPLICYLLYTSLLSSTEAVRNTAANLWRIILVQKPAEAAAILGQTGTAEQKQLAGRFEKLVELDNETFLYWVDEHREDLDCLFPRTLSKSWDAFVNEENKKTEESSRARISRRGEKLKQWAREESDRTELIRRHEVTFDHWTANIYSSEYLKHQRLQQDQQDDANFTEQSFMRMQRDLTRPGGVFEEVRPRKWRLDQTEGRNRMRMRIHEDFTKQSHSQTPKRKGSEAPVLQIETKNHRMTSAEAVGLTPGGAQSAPDSPNQVDQTGEPFPEVQDNGEAAKVEEVDDSFELIEDPNEVNAEFEDKNRKVMRSLHRGDQVKHVANISRILGLEAVEGLLILGKDYLYLIDNFFQRADGEIVNVWQAPREERDSYIRMISGRDVEVRKAVARDDEHETRSWKLSDVISISKRRFLFRDVAIEVFFADGRSYLLTVTSPQARNELHHLISARAPAYGSSERPQSEASWRYETLKSVDDEPQGLGSKFANVFGQSAAISATKKWQKGELSNFHYLMLINTLAGRTYNDLTQYPVFPWVIADYTSEELDLDNPATFRNLTKPMGCQTSAREAEFRERYNTFAEMSDEKTPAFHYGTHYSSAMIVTSFLIRLQPFVKSYLLLQGGTFDHPDRMFFSIEQAWRSASRINMTDVRELTPEFFYLPEFLTNINGYDFGMRQNSTESIGDVKLPPWAKGDPKIFIAKNREALESAYVSRHLHNWIDLVFGCKQKGEAAIESVNVFHHLSYQGARNLDAISDPVERLATIGIIHNFGQTPYQVFQKPHPARENVHHKYKRLDSAAESLTRLPATLLESEERVASMVYSWRADRLLCSGAFRLYIPPHYDNYMEWGFSDNSLRFYAADSRKQIGLFEHVHIGQLSSALFADSKTLITSGADCTVAVWSVTSTSKSVDIQPRASLFGHRQPVHVLAISRSFNALLSASTSGELMLWDLNRCEFVRRIDECLVLECAWINDVTGNLVLCHGSFISMYSINGDLLLKQDVGDAGGGDIVSVACYEGAGNEWLERDIIFTGHRRGVVKVWSKVVRDGRFELELIRQLNHTDHKRGDGGNVTAAISCILAMPQTLYTGDEDGQVPDNLDFDARVPIPISIFPSTYRSEAASEQTADYRLGGEAQVTAGGRFGREDTRYSSRQDYDINVRDDRRQARQDINTNIYQGQDRVREDRAQVDISRERYPDRRAPLDNQVDIEVGGPARRTDVDVSYDQRQKYEQVVQDQLDITEQDYRRRLRPTVDVEYERRRPATTEVETDIQKRDMGYYDDEGQYHSFRRGVERAADRILHPFDPPRRRIDEVRGGDVDVEVTGPRRVREGLTENVRLVAPRRSGRDGLDTITIPCHFIRIGDLLILQGRVCEVIRISISSSTGQYRFLGVDLFTKKLQEESSFDSNPESSVYVQSMLGPVFKQYRILDIRQDGLIVALTESGDVKQGLPVIDNGGLFSKIERAFADGCGSVRALVINDGGRELVVDYKVIHGSRL
ncbi:hypothetical protein DV738_g1137, partial [Chaetothyriales sp. CBS 135597]